MSRTKVIRDRLPGPRWWVKAAVASSVVFALTAYLADRYEIRIDPQVERCIPGARAFLVDTHTSDVEAGDLVAFKPPALGELFDANAEFVKRVAAQAGQRVTVGAANTRVGNQMVARGLGAAEALGVAPARFVRTETVPAGALWVVAPGPRSVDSRYWGALDRNNVIGKAYVLF